MFFSHVIKAQEENMDMLDAILRKNIRLIDYEKISDENGRRLVAFGRFAGNAGTIDILSGIGKFLLNQGIGSSLLNISQSYLYFNIHHAKNSIRQVGENIRHVGLNPKLVPFIVGNNDELTNQRCQWYRKMCYWKFGHFDIVATFVCGNSRGTPKNQ